LFIPIFFKQWWGSDFAERNQYRGYIDSLDIEVMTASHRYSNLQNKDAIERSLGKLINQLNL